MADERQQQTGLRAGSGCQPPLQRGKEVAGEPVRRDAALLLVLAWCVMKGN